MKSLWTFLCLTVIFLTVVDNPVTAQYKNWPPGLNKNEIAIDLQNFFSYGYPDKVLFKISHIKEKQVKGAYRFGLGASHMVDIWKSTDDNESYREIKRLKGHTLSLLLGYEFQKKLNHAVFFYGVDLGAIHHLSDDSEFAYTSNRNELFFVPFAGAKVPISDNLSLAFEAGLDNRLNMLKSEGSLSNPDSRSHTTIFQSKIKLPYSLTFNFNF